MTVKLDEAIVGIDQLERAALAFARTAPGQIVAATIEQMLAELITTVIGLPGDPLRSSSGRSGTAARLDPDPVALSIPATDANVATAALDELRRAEVQVSEFSLGQPSLDETFLALTGRPTEEAA